MFHQDNRKYLVSLRIAAVELRKIDPWLNQQGFFSFWNLQDLPLTKTTGCERSGMSHIDKSSSVLECALQSARILKTIVAVQIVAERVSSCAVAVLNR